MTQIKYPIAEVFTSIQGEGVFTGAQMTFVRLAGCNVGVYQGSSPFATCTTVDGREFVCDTDYHRTGWMTVQEILGAIGPVGRMCLTGGEPFLHNLESLFDACLESGIAVHIETSGTKPMLRPPYVHISCCPKKGFLEENYLKPDEWKFLLSDLEQLGKIKEFLKSGDTRPVSIQPINGVWQVNEQSLRKVQAALELNPTWRLSIQLHKIVGVR